MDEVIEARSLGDLKGDKVDQYDDNRKCNTCGGRLSIYNPNKNCGACYASGKVELK